MNQELVNPIVSAVLYEGYVLYPYRPSVKNRQRWTFGGLYPRAYSEAKRGLEPCFMQTQVPVIGSERSSIEVLVRFLHLTDRTVWQADDSGDLSAARPVESLIVGDKRFQSWQEAIECEVPLDPVEIGQLLECPVATDFAFPKGRECETLRRPDGRAAGQVVRQRQELAGTLELSARRASEGVFVLTARVENRTPIDPALVASRDDALMRALVSTHAVLQVRDGELVSLTDPPESMRDIAADCRNVGCWPVLVGTAPDAHTMLASPIILYDYPQVAPESPGELFDGTEIDEILSLRVMTLTDEEKRQAAATDERVAALLARTDALGPGQLMNLHGALRGLRAVPAEQPHA